MVKTTLKNAGNRPKKPPLFPSCAAHCFTTVCAVDLKLQPFNFANAVARAGLTPQGQPVAKPASGASFADAMSSALKSVSAQQNEASRLQREVQLDNPTVSLEETMVAMQKAQIGFQATLQVRNRLVSAYSEIMNMQV
jgi:flagellar hook-basal body complex protein FliE